MPGRAGRPSGKDAVGPRTRVCEPEGAGHGESLDYLKLVPTRGKKKSPTSHTNQLWVDDKPT